MEHVACSKCEWDGNVPSHCDTCPHCHEKGTLVDYEAVAWALGNTVTQGAR